MNGASGVLESDERKELRARLENDASLGAVFCDEAVRETVCCITAFRDSVLAWHRSLSDALYGFENAVDQHSAALLRNGSENRKSTDGFLAVCNFLVCLGEKKAVLDEAMLGCCDFRERAATCRARLLRAQGTVYTVRSETDTETDSYLRELEWAEAELARVTRVFAGYHENVFSLLTGAFPQFLQRLRESADFSGKGAACDWREIGVLCNALQYAIKNIPKPCFEQ